MNWLQSCSCLLRCVFVLLRSMLNDWNAASWFVSTAIIGWQDRHMHTGVNIERMWLNGDNCLTSKERLCRAQESAIELNDFLLMTCFLCHRRRFPRWSTNAVCDVGQWQRNSCLSKICFCHNSYNFPIVVDGTDVFHRLMSRLDDSARIHNNFPWLVFVCVAAELIPIQ